MCLAWGRGCGKSWFDRACMFTLVAACDGVVRQTPKGPLRGVRVNLLFPTLKHFTRLGHAQNLLDELAPDGAWGSLRAEIRQTDWKVTFPGGSYIQVLTAESSNRGARCDLAVTDEADEVPRSYYESVIGPWFTEPFSYNMQIISGTPLRGRYGLLWHAFHVWPHGDAHHAPDPTSYSYHATAYDASKLIISHAEVERARRTITPTRFETEYMCNFDSGEGLVYPFFDVKFHVRTPPDRSQFHTYIVGVDYGFEDPSVFVVIGIAGSGLDTICHVVDEFYMLGKSDSQLAAKAQQVDKLYPGAYWYADHRPQTTQQLKDEAGIRIVAADKGPDSVESGVAYVADALFIREHDGARWAQLYVDPKCIHTIDEFGLYRRKRDSRNADRILDVIDSSKNDHCLDGIRMALFSHFVGPLKRLERRQQSHGANA